MMTDTTTMAQVIVMAIDDLEFMPPAQHDDVTRIAAWSPKALYIPYVKACNIIDRKLKKENANE